MTARVRGVVPDGAPGTALPVELDGGGSIRADVVIGADGATRRVAASAGLVDPRRVLWGFAVRVYLEATTALPHIVLWEPEPKRIFPGYGWLFPGPDGRVNAGLGIGTLSDRRRGGGGPAPAGPSSTISVTWGCARPARRRPSSTDWGVG